MIQVFIGGSPVDFDNVYFYCQREPSSGALKYELYAWNPRVMELLCHRLPLGQAMTLSFIEASYVFEILRGTRNVQAERGDAAYLANTIEEFFMSSGRVYVRGRASIRAP
ncbi:MAG TPA: hypothetical protein VKU80_16270 [Planctomycetota bacterium]|nr:hypothetical protein [Planctomycetota bacterium]